MVSNIDEKKALKALEQNFSGNKVSAIEIIEIIELP